MSSPKSFVTVALVCLQMLFVSVAGAGISASNDLHVATSHEQVINHHHHDAFSSHSDHSDSSEVHHHTGDSLQSIALVPEMLDPIHITDSEARQRLSLDPPLDIFLDGLLRPPQMIL
jgi:hypothetical protein